MFREESAYRIISNITGTCVLSKRYTRSGILVVVYCVPLPSYPIHIREIY